jgi:hypothetical protein
MPVFGKPPQVVVDLFEHAGQICVLEPVPLRFDPGSAPRYAARRLPAAVPELSVVMPVFNARATVGAAVDELLGAELGVAGVELVLVDDGSRGGTREVLGNGNWPESVQMHLGDRNAGNGAVVRTGLGCQRPLRDGARHRP